METIPCLLKFTGGQEYKQNLICNRKCIAPGVAMIHSNTQATITGAFMESVIHKRMPYENSKHQQVLCRLLVNMTLKINIYSFWKTENLLWKKLTMPYAAELQHWKLSKYSVANPKGNWRCFYLRLCSNDSCTFYCHL